MLRFLETCLPAFGIFRATGEGRPKWATFLTSHGRAQRGAPRVPPATRCRRPDLFSGAGVRPNAWEKMVTLRVVSLWPPGRAALRARSAPSPASRPTSRARLENLASFGRASPDHADLFWRDFFREGAGEDLVAAAVQVRGVHEKRREVRGGERVLHREDSHAGPGE